MSGGRGATGADTDGIRGGSVSGRSGSLIQADIDRASSRSRRRISGGMRKVGRGEGDGRGRAYRRSRAGLQLVSSQRGRSGWLGEGGALNARSLGWGLTPKRAVVRSFKVWVRDRPSLASGQGVRGGADCELARHPHDFTLAPVRRPSQTHLRRQGCSAACSSTISTTYLEINNWAVDCLSLHSLDVCASVGARRWPFLCTLGRRSAGLCRRGPTGVAVHSATGESYSAPPPR